MMDTTQLRLQASAVLLPRDSTYECKSAEIFKVAVARMFVRKVSPPSHGKAGCPSAVELGNHIGNGFRVDEEINSTSNLGC